MGKGKKKKNLIVAKISIQERISPEGKLLHYFKAVDGEGNTMPLTECLGMLILGIDSAIRQSMEGGKSE